MGIYQRKKRTMLMLAVFILTLLPLPAIAASETPQQEISLSLEQAIIRALNNSDSVKKAGAEVEPVSYTHLRAHETVLDLVCRLLLEKKKKQHIKKDHQTDDGHKQLVLQYTTRAQ